MSPILWIDGSDTASHQADLIVSDGWKQGLVRRREHHRKEITVSKQIDRSVAAEIGLTPQVKPARPSSGFLPRLYHVMPSLDVINPLVTPPA